MKFDVLLGQGGRARWLGMNESTPELPFAVLRDLAAKEFSLQKISHRSMAIDRQMAYSRQIGPGGAPPI